VEDPGTVYFTGTAGAGKTSLVRATADWMRSAGYATTVVNLDPGSEGSSLEPDVDIREWVRLAEVQDEYGLGPNGAQVAAADMIALKVFDLRQAVEELKSDYVLIDTPGQIELFAFREASKAMVDALGGDRSAVAFLYDPALTRSAGGFVSLRMLSATIEFRFRLPIIPILSKVDVLKSEQLTEILAWSEDPTALYDAVTREAPTPEVQLSTELFRAIESMEPLSNLLPVSAQEGTGIENVYRSFQQIFGADEDLEPSQATGPE